MSLLTQYELTSSAWLKLREHMEERLALLRKKNDGDLTERETSHTRGQIFALKSLIGLSIATASLIQEDSDT